jgi:hypothetical protein
MPKRATRPATGKGNQVNHLEVSRVPACSMTTTTPVVLGQVTPLTNYMQFLIQHSSENVINLNIRSKSIINNGTRGMF